LKIHFFSNSLRRRRKLVKYIKPIYITVKCHIHVDKKWKKGGARDMKRNCCGQTDVK
jgi:hypothetical protein